MVLVTKSATIQLRVMPLVKAASERILLRIGLNMSEAVELFLRRIIVDVRLPFEVVALSVSKFDMLADTAAAGESVALIDERAHTTSNSNRGVRGSRQSVVKKEFKTFSGAHTPSRLRRQNRQKKSSK